MWMPPDLGRQYTRELERKQLEEAYEREGRTGRPSPLLRTKRLEVGRRLLFLGIGLVALIAVLAVVAALTSPPAGG